MNFRRRLPEIRWLYPVCPTEYALAQRVSPKRLSTPVPSPAGVATVKNVKIAKDPMPTANPTPDPQTPPLPRPPGRQMRMGRFLLIFAVSLAVLFSLLLAPLSEPAVRHFTRGLVTVSAALIRIFGGKAVALGDLLENPVSHFGIQMAYGCNGAHVTILLWAAVLAFPASWMQKAKGLAAGTAAIHVVNLLRFISLFYVGQYSRAWFDFAHLYLWESLMMLDTLVIFWTWAYFVRKSGLMVDANR